MRHCPNCSQPNLEGEIYCQACGMALEPVPLTTRVLTEHGSHSGTDRLGPEAVILLVIEDDEEPIVVQVQREVILGRINDQREGMAFINLSPYGAMDRGVSRQHARLLREDDALYLLDLRSTNGTLLNGELLPTSVEWRVRDGDEITLGRLKIMIFFKLN